MMKPFWTTDLKHSAAESRDHLKPWASQVAPLMKAIPLPEHFFVDVVDDETVVRLTRNAVQAVAPMAAFASLQNEVGSNGTVAMHFGRLLWLRGGTEFQNLKR